MKVGYVPEHFSTPLFFAKEQGYYTANNVEPQFIPFPSGSGHLIQSLKDGSIDVAIGLTEAFVSGIGKGADWYKIVGTYVESPLCWSISTGYDRSDITSEDQLEGKRIGISRIGSGSYVMPFVLAQEKGWSKPFEFEIQNDFKTLRAGVNHAAGVAPTDAFMWEHFTTKKYYDSKEVKKIGQIYTPWPSWVITASADMVSDAVGISQLNSFCLAVNQGIEYFNINPNEAVKYIATNLDYSEEDAREWLKTVKFVKNVATIDKAVIIDKTVAILKNAEVLDSSADDKVYTI